MAASIDPMIVGRVIGDVIDVSMPTVIMSVSFNNKHVTNGCDIKPSIASCTPGVTIAGDADQYYTLVMIDPDAPSPSEPSLREWVHWIVTDIPGCCSISQGKEILSYTPPHPTLGIHRYIMVLFEQNAPLGFLAPPMSRARFCTRAFAQHFNLGIPVSIVYFNAQREPRGGRR